MAIRLYSGLPGAGKTLSLVAELTRMHKAEPGRPVFAYGIDGLKDGLAAPCDPVKWQDLPDGAIVVVDEAQKVWPSRRAGDPPENVRAFSEHRHRGFDFLIATQSPSYLDSYLRGLVDEHTHVVRRWGSTKVDRYIWQEGVDDPKSQSMRARAQRQKWRYPKECYGLYKSSTMHTVKRRIPWQAVALPLCIIAVPLLFWYGIHKAKSVGTAGMEKAGAKGSDVAVVGAPQSGRVHYATPVDYVKAFTPRVAAFPWSAPAYDDRAVRAEPDLMCVEHENPNVPDEMLCSCYTEQVTPYAVGSLAICRTYARHGVYNPHRQPLRAQGEERTGARETAQARREASPTVEHGSGTDWQPAWRTRSYVQPERTQASPIVSKGAGGV